MGINTYDIAIWRHIHFHHIISNAGWKIAELLMKGVNCIITVVGNDCVVYYYEQSATVIQYLIIRTWTSGGSCGI